MNDRLAEIKARAADPKIPWQKDDVVWLIAEVERLRAENAPLKQSNARFFDDVVALRGALQALVDATAGIVAVKPLWIMERIEPARAAAVALLAGPGGRPKGWFDHEPTEEEFMGAGPGGET